MKSDYLILIIILFVFGFIVFAQEEAPPGVTFPIPELGNCASEAECRAYCDLPENAEACITFALAHNLISPEEAEMARQMLDTVGTIGGPGGCQSEPECEAYCSEPAHMEECIVFALEHDLIPPDEIEEAQMALTAIRAGATPPPCRGRAECDVYCADPAHLEECLEFGIAAGFISPDEAEMIRKTGGQGPGGCQGKEECEAYCENPANMEECILFAIEHDLMPPEEAEEVQMMLQAIRQGVTPPPCRGDEECQEYCSQPEHMEECINFAVAAGMMSPEEAEQALRMAEAGIFGGPGGCMSEEECEAYCEDPDHMLECIDFAERAGFMSAEEAEQARKMAAAGIMGGPGGCQSQEECEAYCQDPAHAQECMEFAVAAGFMSPEEAERMQAMGEIEQMGGPGGCMSEEECEAYCADPARMEECMMFAQEHGLVSPEEAEAAMILGPGGPGGPGGCRSEAECMAYCEDPAHNVECIQFSAEQGFISPEEAEEMLRMLEMPGGIMGPSPEEMMEPPEEEYYPPEEMPMIPSEEMMPEEEMMAPPEEMVLPEEELPPEEEISPPPEEVTPPPEEVSPPPEEVSPPPEETTTPSVEEEAPQSLFDRVKNFLASLITAFGL